MKKDNNRYIPPCNNPTMLYQLGGEHEYYERKYGYVKYDSIIVDDKEIEEYVQQGWFKSIPDAIRDRDTPKPIPIIVPSEPVIPETATLENLDSDKHTSNKSKSKGKNEAGDDNL